MKKLTVLVTNDDGPRSPLLIPFLDAIRSQPFCGELRVVIPAEEQSWIAKSITRFRPLQPVASLLGAHPAFLVNGTPADCVSLGICNLFPEPPDVVLSGINMGTNAGRSFFLSSGTVGGAVEATLYHVGGIAFSADLPREIFEPWKSHDEARLKELTAEWLRLAQVSARIAGEFAHQAKGKTHDLLTINIPWGATEQTVHSLTHLTDTFFHGLFQKTGDNEFRHRFQGLKTIDRDESGRPSSPYKGDIAALEQGEISVTPILLHLSGELQGSASRHNS